MILLLSDLDRTALLQPADRVACEAVSRRHAEPTEVFHPTYRALLSMVARSVARLRGRASRF